MNPMPSVEEMIDPSRVTPGLLGLLFILFLLSAVVVIWFTMRKSLRTTDENFEPGKEGRVKPDVPRPDSSTRKP
jgi:hypothetical protein